MSLSTWWANTRPPKHAAPTTSTISAREWRIAQVLILAVSTAMLVFIGVGPAGTPLTEHERTLEQCYQPQFGGCQFHPHYERTTAHG